MSVRFSQTIPALPVRDMAAAVQQYTEQFGFRVGHHEGGFAVLVRDEAVIHLWEASDMSWRHRADLGDSPVCSGAESFIAGTASCRIAVDDPDALFAELSNHPEVLHGTSREGVTLTDFGSREFHAVDTDGNLLTFFRWEP
jgi:catechol 2,3-dioxygenase-like lactoylglutathione lyase family enzyme